MKETSPESSLVHVEASAEAAALVLSVSLPRDRHPAAVYLARLAKGSRRTMRTALQLVAQLVSGGRCDIETLDWGALRYQHTAAVRAVLQEKYAPASANKMLSALRGVLKESWRLGQMDAEAHARAADVPSIRGTSLPHGRALSSGELKAMFEACGRDRTPAGVRDAALLAVLYGGGLRRSELVALDLDDYHVESGALKVRSGKGRKARVCYAHGGSAHALSAWLAVRGEIPGALFFPIDKVGRIKHRRMTDQAVLYILQKRGREAGVAHFSPHDLRRTFIGDLLDAGADIATVQSLAGHANVQTTVRYDRRGEATRKRAAEMLHVPYTGSDYHRNEKPV